MLPPITIHGKPMRALWVSNAPWTPGGYGQQTALVTRSFRDRLGIQVGIFANFGLMGGKLDWDGIPIYPLAADPFGNDIAAAHAKTFGADILLTHQDVWTQHPNKLTQTTRWVSWPPLDSEPVAPQIALRLRETYQTIALSRFGEAQARAAGLDVRLVPQAIDTAVFTPGSREEARRLLNWLLGAFIVGMVAMNKGFPSRKALGEQLEAFAQFAAHHPDALIYIHTFGHPSAGDREATPIEWHLRRHGLERRAIWAHPYDLTIGHSQEEMVTRFRAFDFLSAVSRSEGFGLPIIEAQSCGIPVVTGDWTAMSEITFAGWKVAREDSEPWYVDPLECEWRTPHVGAIAEKLEEAYSVLQNTAQRADLAEYARSQVVTHHDQAYVTDAYWRPVLEELAARIEAEPVPYHKHRWARNGYETAQGGIVRCQVSGCPAELVVNGEQQQVYPAGAPLIIDGITLDIEDDPVGGVARAIAQEIEETYRLQDLNLQAGDVVIDVGAHVGVVSCYLAKKFPRIDIMAFEPIPENFARLKRNIERNSCTNVTAFNVALSGDGRPMTLYGDPDKNTGHYSAWDRGPVAVEVEGGVLDRIAADFLGVSRIALLKLDCEGAEYEILRGMNGTLDRVQRLVMEVHESAALRATFGLGVDLVRYARAHVGNVKASIIEIPDGEEATHAIF